MADLNYTANIDTRGAERALNGLKNTILGFSSAVAGAFTFRELTNVSTRFEDLRTTLQLLYRDVGVGAAAFDDIKQFAQTSVFSVEELTNTIVKLKAAGIEPTVSLLRLFADTSAVAADKVGALNAITDLYARTTAGGLGLEDLNRLADRGIPVFTILSERLGLSRLEISKVGQTAEGARVILQALEEGLQDAFGGASASRANNLSQAFSNFGDSVANAADILGQSGLNEGLGQFLRAITELINRNKEAIAVIGQGLGAAFKFLADNIEIVVAFFGGMVISLIKNIVVFTGLAKAIKDVTLALLVMSKALLATPWGRIAALLGAAAALFVDFGSDVDSVKQELNGLADSNGFKVLQEGNLGNGAEDLREKIKLLNQELNKFKAEMNTVVTEFARYNQQTRDALSLETSLIGVARELQELRRAEAEINIRAANEIAKLTAEKAKLTEEERKQGRAGIIDETIKKIQQQADADKEATKQAIAANEARQRARQVELFSIQTQIDLQEQLFRIQDDIAKSTMTEIEQRYYDIEAAARRSARAAIAAEEARIGRPLNADEQRKYYDEAVRGSERLRRASEQQYNQARTFSTGWKRAFNEYIENATNAAKVAERLFTKAFQGIEDALVGFVKTGRFEWKTFVADMAEELLRSQIRQTLAGLAGALGLGDLFGGGGQAVGTSPNNPMYVLDISGGGGGIGGGGGPLISGGGFGGGQSSGGIFDTIGNIFSGVKNTVGGIVSGVGSVIGKVGSLFGGFFANGGTLPAGKFGIVGERGPELISGPASITPMMGGNVTYNINAVDAASFKALVAQDPAFIHAVAMQGAMTIPSRR